MGVDYCKSPAGKDRLLCGRLEAGQTNPYAELWERSSAESRFINANGRYLGNLRTYDGGRVFVGMLLSAVSHERDCRELDSRSVESVGNINHSEETDIFDTFIELSEEYDQICNMPIGEFQFSWINSNYLEYLDKKAREILRKVDVMTRGSI